MSPKKGNGKLDSHQTIQEISSALDELYEQLQNYTSLRKIAQLLVEKHGILHQKIEDYQKEIDGHIRAFDDIYRDHHESLEENGALQRELRAELSELRQQAGEQIRELDKRISGLLQQLISHKKVVNQVIQTIPSDLSNRLQQMVENMERQVESLPRLHEYLNELPLQDAMDTLKALQQFYQDNRDFQDLIRVGVKKMENAIASQDELYRKLLQIHSPLERLMNGIRRSDQAFKEVSLKLSEDYENLRKSVYASAQIVSEMDRRMQAIMAGQNHFSTAIDDAHAQLRAKVSHLAKDQHSLNNDVKHLLRLVKQMWGMIVINMFSWGALGAYLIFR